jgi:tetratricopeptide (TPR) repeat protein
VTTNRCTWRRSAGACGLVAMLVSPAWAAHPAQVPAQSTAPAAKAGKPGPTASSPQFDQLVKSATAAREAGHWEDAVDLYTKIVKLRPDYAEGYWYQGTALYELDRFQECRDSFRRVIRFSPKNGSAYAFLGLCEFGLKNYDSALEHLMQSRSLGVADKDLGGVARYHAGIVMTRIQQYSQALQTLGEFAVEGNDNPRIIEAMGIATLRMAMLPNEVPPDRREMVLMAGRGSYMMATRMTAAAGKAFEALVARYPETPNIHYAYGVFLLIEQPAKAIEEFKRELEIQPSEAESLMQIAYQNLKDSDPASALPWAKQAVEVAPNVFAAHRALGEALVGTGDVEEGIAQLEIAINQAPDSPGTHFALSKAYQRAGRADDAARERAEFVRLDRLARTNRSGSQSVGGIDMQRVGPATGGSQPVIKQREEIR